MKLSVVVLTLFSFVSISSALPVVPLTEVLQVRETPAEPFPLANTQWQKRDIAALTYLFKTLNTTGTGVSLIETAISISLTQQQVIKFVGSLIETKGLTSLLEAAETSGLALDLVLLVLTHYEVIPGITNVIKAYKGGSSNTSSSSSSSSLFGGLLGSVLGGLDNGTDSSDVSVSSADFGALEGILGSATDIGSIATGSGLLATQTPSTAVVGSAATTSASANGFAGLFPDLLNGLGLALASDAALTLATTSAPATDITTPAAVAPASVQAATTPTIATSSAQTSSTGTSTGKSGGLISSLLGSIFKRDDLDEAEKLELVGSLFKRGDIDLGNVLQSINSREDVSPEELAIAKRDLLSTVYLQIILIIGSDNNIELIAESLSKSGLGTTVVYEAFTNEDFVDFDVNLVKYLVDQKIITVSGLLSAASQSGLLGNIFGDLVGNATYRQLVIDFALAAITGKIDVIDLVAALF